ncbi:hypothetical protein RHGRI_033202 [Rhododendron griersonianum]|uniref:Uncharacterized protein n=1 Tax=Rhododendron griersonianum TaxID=479676 RepID=A0AAV6I012_9ERIC|nr:hypothetical protein RHGRI_033202 [Rhododendron griersonianum]
MQYDRRFVTSKRLGNAGSHAHLVEKQNRLSDHISKHNYRKVSCVGRGLMGYLGHKLLPLVGVLSFSNMVVRVPFRRWVHVKHRNPQTPHGGFYCLLPIQGRRVIVAVTRYQRPGHLEYKAFSVFVLEYREMLGLNENLVWAVRDDLVNAYNFCCHQLHS